MPRKQSRTVDLRRVTIREKAALGYAAGCLDVQGLLPAAAHEAVRRLYGGMYAQTIQRVPRRSLRALADAFREQAQADNPAVRDAVRDAAAAIANLETRLASKPGRPATPDLWESRARDAAQTARKLKSELRRWPTDNEIEAAMQWQPGVLRKWRNHKPGMFPPAH